MSKMTAQNYFAHVTQVAKELDAAEKSGGPLPPEVLDGEFSAWSKFLVFQQTEILRFSQHLQRLALNAMC